jgi:hypothetical protein
LWTRQQIHSKSKQWSMALDLSPTSRKAVQQIHSKSTTNPQQIVQVDFELERGFIFSGPAAAWNNLPDYVQQTTDINQFKKLLKIYFFLSRVYSFYFNERSWTGFVYAALYKYVLLRNVICHQSRHLLDILCPLEIKLAFRYTRNYTGKKHLNAPAITQAIQLKDNFRKSINEHNIA